ncbi:MAG: DNA translocase FtsK, partial [Candidatus Kapaibacterium sp.]
MPEHNEDIIIERVKKPSDDNDGDIAAKKGPGKSKSKKKNSRQYDKQLKASALILMFFAGLLFLAMLSYTPLDQANTIITFDEFTTIFGEESQVSPKFSTTRNWLGLVGAMMSDFFYNSTFGYASIFLPFFIFAWAWTLLIGKKPGDGLIKKTSFYLGSGVLFASLIGSMQETQVFMDIPDEWSGAIGKFMASVVSGIFGSIGAIILFFAAFIITAIAATPIKIDALLKKASSIAELSGIALSDKLTKFKNKAQARMNLEPEEKNIESTNDIPKDSNDNKKAKSESSANEPQELPAIPRKEPEMVIKNNKELGEPARIIRKNLAGDELNRQADNPVAELIRVSTSKPQNIRMTPNEPEDIIYTSQDIERLRNQALQNYDESIDIARNNASSDKDITEDQSSGIADKTETGQEDMPGDMPSETFNVSGNHTANISGYNESRPARVVSPTAEMQTGTRKPLRVTVNESEEESKPELKTPLCTGIHDEEILYIPPSLEMLNTDIEKAQIDEEELKNNARILQEKLETFKIYIENLSVTPGPVVTQYEFVPAPGIKLSKIEGLSDDLAMALKARGIRIIAPIPGKGTVGIEIPNSNPALVRFSDVISSSKFTKSNARLPLALGKTISGEVFVTDLTKMPHLLIAGSTGSGKSVGINTVINSLIFKMHPRNLKFAMIDPKKVELPQYAQLRDHFLCVSPDVDDLIVTNPQDAVILLKSLVAEMELRYDILAKVGQRNIKDYNQKVNEGKFINDKTMDHRTMPYIVVIVDELADLMLTASKEIEEPIARLAQMARAVGIHLVLATQRPSVDVITGIIKANFPARISYLVASKIDSRTILDVGGAEQLLGNGDMLCLPPNSPKPERVQNAFIDTDEVERVCDHIGDQQGYSQPYMLPSINDNKSGGGGIDSGDRDELFEEAARLVIRHQQGSVSLIQRRLKVGYARAGRIVDELEAAG